MNLILSPNRTTILNFVKPVTVISPSRPPVKQTTPPESITTTVILSPYSTHSQTTTVTITTENTSQIYMYTTESSTQPQSIEVESLRPQIKIIGGVLGAVVIILGILIIIVTVVVILRKKGRKASFDLTTNEAYTDRIIQCHARLIDEGDNEAIEHGTADLSKVPLEQNAAYMVKSPIVAARNVAYENTSEFSEYDYILNAQ